MDINRKKLAGALRHILTAGGGAATGVAAIGVINSDKLQQCVAAVGELAGSYTGMGGGEVQALIGAVVTLVGFAWSWRDKSKAT